MPRRTFLQKTFQLARDMNGGDEKLKYKNIKEENEFPTGNAGKALSYLV